LGRCDGLARRNRVGRLVFDVEAVLVVEAGLVRRRLPLTPSRRSLGRKRPHVETLTEQVNTLEEREPFHQPADPIVNREPGFLGRRVAVAAASAAGWRLEAGIKPTIIQT